MAVEIVNVQEGDEERHSSARDMGQVDPAHGERRENKKIKIKIDGLGPCDIDKKKNSGCT